MTTVIVGSGPIWTPRPRYRKDGSRAYLNPWHHYLMQVYSDETWRWVQKKEEETLGYEGSEERYFRERFPCPQLKDFMIQLSREWRYSKEES